MDRVAASVSLAALFMATAGCMSLSGSPGIEPAGGSPQPRPVLVALLDTGINPYHQVFKAAPGLRVDDLLHTVSGPGSDEVILLRLSEEGAYADRREADGDLWDSLELGPLYAFSETRVFAKAFHERRPTHIIEDATLGHGTATASLVVREAPQAVVIMVNAGAGACVEHGNFSCFMGPSYAAAMLWAASQPWIDVITSSMNVPENLPDHERLHPEVRAYLDASRLAHANGKIVINSAGNSPLPPLTSYFAGPPWMIAVGGAEPAPRGDPVLASHAADVVANFTDWVARPMTLDGYGWYEGTSFAAPNVAGVLARSLAEIRAALGHVGGITAEGALAEGTTADGRLVRVTNEDLRRALNASATYYAATEWDPTKPTANETLHDLLGANVPVVFQPAQQGWGYVDGALVPEIVRRVLEDDLDAGPEKAVTAAWMDALMRARWARYDG